MERTVVNVKRTFLYQDEQILNNFDASNFKDWLHFGNRKSDDKAAHNDLRDGTNIKIILG